MLPFFGLIFLGYFFFAVANHCHQNYDPGEMFFGFFGFVCWGGAVFMAAMSIFGR